MKRGKRAFAIGCLFLMPAATPAQGVEINRTRPPALGERRSAPLLEQALSLVAAGDLQQRSGNDQPQSRQGKRTTRRRVFGAIVGAAGGFFAGGYTGAWIEGDRCHCDDPGLKGALIGAPVGAAVGGVLGGLYLF